MNATFSMVFFLTLSLTHCSFIQLGGLGAGMGAINMMLMMYGRAELRRSMEARNSDEKKKETNSRKYDAKAC